MSYSSRSGEGGCNGRCASPSTARTAHGPDHMPLAHSARHPELPHLVSAKHSHVPEDATLTTALLDYHPSSVDSALAHHAKPCVTAQRRWTRHPETKKASYTIAAIAMSAPPSGYSRNHNTQDTVDKNSKAASLHQSLDRTMSADTSSLRLGVWLGSWPIRRCK